MVLPVTLAQVKLLCGIGDTSQDTAITAMLALVQPALEYALDPAILTNSGSDTGLSATLVLGVAEAIAGTYLQTATLDPLTPPVQQLFRISTLEVSTKPLMDASKTGAALAALGLARLAPFSRSARALARAAAGSDAALDDLSPVPLLLGAGMGQSGAISNTSNPLSGGSQGPPADSTFDAVLGVDGTTDPPSGDIVSPGLFGFFPGGPE